MKALGYVRVSTDEQARQGLSLEAQRQKIEQYCALQNLQLEKVYCDEKSAKDTNRPGLQELLADAGGCVVVVYKLDRMFRNTVDALEGLKKLDSKAVAFVSISESLDTKSAIGRFVVTIMAALAQMEREQIGERTRVVMQNMRANGRKTGPPPYGFRVVPDHERPGKSLLLENKEEQSLIAWMETKKKSGDYTLREIADELNDMGVPAPRSQRRLLGQGNRGKWYASTVGVILKRKGGK